MGAPGWLAATFAAVMIAVAVCCVARLVTAWRWQRPTELDADGVHVVMGVAMAGMFTAGLRTLPTGLWEVVFGVTAAWFGWQTVRARRGVTVGPWRCPHPLPHVVESAAMLYMFLALGRAVRPGSEADGAMPGMGMAAPGAHLSVLAVALTLFIVGYVMWLGDRLRWASPALVEAAGPGAPDREGGPDAPAPPPRGNGAAGAAVAVMTSPALGVARTCQTALAPRSAAGYKIAMAVTMCYMLILMV